MRFAFYISGKSGRVMKFLHQAKTDIISQIIIVISEYEICEDMIALLDTSGIEYIVFDYKDLYGNTNKEKNLSLSDSIEKTLEKYSIDYCFSFGSHILSGNLLQKYEYRLINFHPSILPMYPGRNAIDQAAADAQTFLVGNTAHFIDSGMDTGMIIMQSVIPMQIFLDSHDYDTIMDMQIDMLNQLIYVLNKRCLQIIDGRVYIKGANYHRHMIYPFIDINEQSGDGEV